MYHWRRGRQQRWTRPQHRELYRKEGKVQRINYKNISNSLYWNPRHLCRKNNTVQEAWWHRRWSQEHFFLCWLFVIYNYIFVPFTILLRKGDSVACFFFFKGSCADVGGHVPQRHASTRTSCWYFPKKTQRVRTSCQCTGISLQVFSFSKGLARSGISHHYLNCGSLPQRQKRLLLLSSLASCITWATLESMY